jgi:glycogen debranching enzyme
MTEFSLAESIVLKEGDVYIVSARDGTVPLRGDHPLGLYREDCRFLSGHELVSTADPLAVQVRLERRLDARGELCERVHLRNDGHEAAAVDVELALAADFRHMFAIRNIVELPPAPVEIEDVDGGLRFAATGSDGVWRTTTVTADTPVERVGDATLRFSLELRPSERQDIELTFALATSDAGDSALTVPPPLRGTRVHADDEFFRRMIDRSLADLSMLRSRLEGATYFAAGVPWYATLFGRDSLISAMELLGFVPEVAEGTLCLLAERIGERVDPLHEEEPGKVLHELRGGEVAARDLTPLARYYGSVDATPLFLCLISQHADWCGDLSLFRRLRDAVEAALGWLEQYGDHDGDGLLDYSASTPQGLRNQGWKDSDHGVIDEHGIPLEPPIALVEAQAYAIRALHGIARLFEHDGEPQRAGELRERALRLEERLERFWLPERGFYGMAIDGGGRTSAALASNQGHLLWAQALAPGRARAVRDALMSDELCSGFGLRTLGSGETGYNPLGYHLGTVWPHDTAICAAGLRSYGFDEDFARLFEGLLEAASHAEGYSLPELFAGFSRREFSTPVPYPVACHPQAWASGALPYLLVSGFGLDPDGLNGRLRVRRPSLPGWLNRVDVKDLAIGGGRVDLRFERGKDGVALTDVRVDGDVEVVVESGGDFGGGVPARNGP